MKSEIQIRGFSANCGQSTFLVVMHCWNVHNQVRNIFSKEIHEVSGPGLDSPSLGKKSKRTQLKPENQI